jgi:hypothetical protein
MNVEKAAGPLYQHTALRYFLNGTHGFYGHEPPGDEENNPFKQFHAPKLLSALIGYGRLAAKFDEPAEVAWAKERFAHVARQAFAHETAPFYWSSPWLTGSSRSAPWLSPPTRSPRGFGDRGGVLSATA